MDRVRPELVAELERDARIELGQSLEAVIRSNPWIVLMGLLDGFVADVGRFGLRDKDNPPQYWAGYQDGIEYVRNVIPQLVEQARALLAEKAAEDEAGAALMGHFLSGSGSVSGS